MIDTAEKLIVRDLRHADRHAVLRIEQDSFVDPWQWKWFEEALELGAICWSVWSNDELAGYMIAIPTDISLHIANLAIAERFRRHGFARTILHRLYEICDRADLREITLEVRRSNLDAISLYESERFELVGTHRGYYTEKEDALKYRRKCECSYDSLV